MFFKNKKLLESRKLLDQERQKLESEIRANSTIDNKYRYAIFIVLDFIVVGSVFWLLSQDGHNTLLKVMLGIMAGLLIYQVKAVFIQEGIKQLKSDLKTGIVYKARGNLKREVSNDKNFGTTRFLNVEGHSFAVDKDVFDKLSDGQVIEVEFLPKSRLLLTLNGSSVI